MIKALSEVERKNFFKFARKTREDNFFLFIHVFICTYIVWAISPPLSFCIKEDRSIKFWCSAIRQEQEMKGPQIGKEEVKPFLFANDMILYLKHPKDFIKIIRNHKLFQQSSRIQN
jgi:hypothetical protein